MAKANLNAWPATAPTRLAGLIVRILRSPLSLTVLTPTFQERRSSPDGARGRGNVASYHPFKKQLAETGGTDFCIIQHDRRTTVTSVNKRHAPLPPAPRNRRNAFKSPKKNPLLAGSVARGTQGRNGHVNSQACIQPTLGQRLRCT